MAAIVVAGLTKRFGDLVAVDDLSFEVEAGTVTGCLGPNGAGKTTTLRMLLGLVTPTTGTATIAGRPYQELEAPKATVGAMLEASGFHPGRSAANHLRVIAAAAGLARSRVEEVLAEVGLGDAAGRRVGGFSLGMRQRLGLAAALMGDPEVLVLDEPGNGLDPEGIRWLRGFLRRYAERGRTVLVSSHALAEVAQTVDRVVIIARGRLVTHSTLAELTQSARPVVRVRTPAAGALRDLLVARGIVAETGERHEVMAFDTTTAVVGGVAAEAGITLHEMGQDRADLEEVFLQLTSSARDESAGGQLP